MKIHYYSRGWTDWCGFDAFRTFSMNLTRVLGAVKLDNDRLSGRYLQEVHNVIFQAAYTT
jgi:hypothetical protein